MDWNQSYTATWRLYFVNQKTWGDGKEIPYLNSASVTADTDSTLIEDASISVDTDGISGYIRLVLEADTGTEGGRASVGTFLVTSPKRSINNARVTCDLECYSVLTPASDKMLPNGWYFPEGGDPIAGAYELLADVLVCPVEPAESDVRTDEAKVAESNETALSMALYLLEDTDYTINISGDGRVTIDKKPEYYSVIFDMDDHDVLLPELTDETDVFDIPNVLRVSDSSNNYETIYNTDEESATSISNIGWEIWSSEQLSLDIGETLLTKGAERMEELSKSVRKISYTREYDPNVKLNDLALFMLPQQGIVGVFRIISQSIEAGAGAQVSEVAEFESYTWRK